VKHLLNTLYITNPQSYLTRDGENIVIKIDGEESFRRPIHIFEEIITFGYMGASPALMHLCTEAGVSLCFMNEYGKFLARVSGNTTGNVLLRREQYRWADDREKSVSLAAGFITGKIVNCRTVLKRCMRDHAEHVDYYLLDEIVDRLNEGLSRLKKAKSLDDIRGVEGEAAKYYFQGLNEAILHQKEDFYILQRNRRPPLDNFNALLSFLYNLLAQNIVSALEGVGLDPYVGFLHRDRPGRASLALDIMEEFRPFLADRLVLSLVNRKQLTKDDLFCKESGGIILTDEGRKTVLTNWQNRKQDILTHPFLAEKTAIGLMPHIQAMLLARHIRGDLDGYPPFFNG
jgi:CRISPR-associated protein Cas1